MPLPTDYTDSTTPTGATTELPATTSRGLNAITGQINTNTTDIAAVSSGVLQPVRVTAEGGLTYTISGGSVTQIAGTTIDGVTVAVGDRIAIMGAPASTGASVANSNQPGNGVYVVTNATTNTTVTRASDMSGSVVPWGVSFSVREGGNANYTFYWVNRAGAFTWGTTALQFSGFIRLQDSAIDRPAGVSNAQTLTSKTIDGASNTLSNIPSTAVIGVTTGNTSQQSQLVVANTAYYVAGSSITVPTNLAVGSRFRWTTTLVKTAAGTGTFNIRIYRGTNGTTADTADVTQAVTAAATAVADAMTVDVEIVVTATGATGAYYWAIVPSNRVSATTGFATSSAFSGTVSSVALNTASLKFGLSFINVTGTPTITVPLVRAQAYV